MTNPETPTIDQHLAQRRSRLSRQLSMAIVTILSLRLTASTEQIPYENRVPDMPYTPAATSPAVPESTPPQKASTPPRVCRPGNPSKFSWPDMGIRNAPIENVGDVPADGGGTRPDDPHGRDASGGYNTVGFYEPGPRPGAEEGTPYFIIHSTMHEKSLLYPRDEKVAKLAELRKLGKATTIAVLQDNGSTCSYSIDASTGMLLNLGKVDEADGYPAIFPKLFSLKKGIDNERPIIAFCTGKFDAGLGTSKNIALLQGKPTN